MRWSRTLFLPPSGDHYLGLSPLGRSLAPPTCLSLIWALGQRSTLNSRPQSEGTSWLPTLARFHRIRVLLNPDRLFGSRHISPYCPVNRSPLIIGRGFAGTPAMVGSGPVVAQAISRARKFSRACTPTLSQIYSQHLTQCSNCLCGQVGL